MLREPLSVRPLTFYKIPDIAVIQMFSLLTRIFIKDRENVTDETVRCSYGVISGVLGIFLNILLFAGKYFAGSVSGSIAVTADAFNNLSDAGSSLITLIGFKFSGMAPDRDHPFGHGRIEYITGLGVSIAVIVMGFELGKLSVEKIFSPAPPEMSWLTIGILAASIAVKLYMFAYNKAAAQKIGSAAMKATAADSLSDAVSTAAVAAAMLIMYFTDLNIDSWAGALVSVFILYTGFCAARDTLKPLLGTSPDPEFVYRISDIVLSHPEVLSLHDLVVHDYGPGRLMISLHAEVPADGNIIVMHDTVDIIERELETQLHCEAVIHMDPIMSSDPETVEMREELSRHISEFDSSLAIHDFRVVRGPTHTNLIFDLVVPPKFHMSSDDIISSVQKIIDEHWDNCFAVIKIDHSTTL